MPSHWRLGLGGLGRHSIQSATADKQMSPVVIQYSSREQLEWMACDLAPRALGDNLCRA